MTASGNLTWLSVLQLAIASKQCFKNIEPNLLRSDFSSLETARKNAHLPPSSSCLKTLASAINVWPSTPQSPASAASQTASFSPGV